MISDRDYMRFRQPRRSAFGNYAVPAIIFLNVVVYLMQGMSGSVIVYGHKMDAITANFGLFPQLVVLQKHFWLLLTYMFVHGGFFHLVLNMWGIYLFGSMLEDRIGSGRFLAMYLISGVLGGLCWLIFNLHLDAPAIGASGALFGVMMAAAMMFPDAMIMLLIPPVPLKLKTFVIVFAAVEVFSIYDGSNVAHLAHLGGFIGGYVFMKIFYGSEVWDIFGFVWRLFTPGNPSRRAAKSWTFTTTSTNELDRLLDKISSNGINSLSEEELETLRRAREEMRK